MRHSYGCYRFLFYLDMEVQHMNVYVLIELTFLAEERTANMTHRLIEVSTIVQINGNTMNSEYWNCSNDFPQLFQFSVKPQIRFWVSNRQSGLYLVFSVRTLYNTVHMHSHIKQPMVVLGIFFKRIKLSVYFLLNFYWINESDAQSQPTQFINNLMHISPTNSLSLSPTQDWWQQRMIPRKNHCQKVYSIDLRKI